MNEAAKKNGQPCARCGMKAGAHIWPNKHPRACSEWLTAAELNEEVARLDDGWVHDSDMEARG